MSMDEECLSTWFVNNYIGQCAQLCPFYISRLFNDVSNVKLQNAVSEIVRWRLNTSLSEVLAAVDFAEDVIATLVSMSSLTMRKCVCWMTELAKIDETFPVYFTALALLQVARRIYQNGFSYDLMNIAATILGHNFRQFTTELEPVELLQNSAVEHLTAFRHHEAGKLGTVVAIVTTDYEALYAYKRGDYQRCLELSTQNVHTLFYAARVFNASILGEFVQLLDDDIVSLTALVIVNPHIGFFADSGGYRCISQVTLSLYLMTQCQLKLHHSLTSLAQTLHYIEDAQRKHSPERILDQLTLKLIEHKVLSISH